MPKKRSQSETNDSPVFSVLDRPDERAPPSARPARPACLLLPLPALCLLLAGTRMCTFSVSLL